MDIYILNEAYERVGVIDEYDSFVWSERFDEPGDFELVVPVRGNQDSRLTPGTYLSHEKSKRIMVVETITDSKGEEAGETPLKVTYSGPSFESLLNQRVDYNDTGGSKQTLMSSSVQRVLMDGVHDRNDRVPNLSFGPRPVYQPSTLNPPHEMVDSSELGWHSVGDWHEKGTAGKPTGYRIVMGDKVGSGDWFHNPSTRVTIAEPTKYNAFPTVCMADDGRLVAGWSRADTHTTGGRGATAFSFDNGRTWSSGPAVADVIAANHTSGVIRLVNVKSRPNVLVALVHELDKTNASSWVSRVYSKVSTDNGATWGARQMNLPFPPSSTYPTDLYWCDDGTSWGLLLAIGYNVSGTNGVHMLQSSNGGATWSLRSVMSTVRWDDYTSGLSEVCVCEGDQPGHLYALARLQRTDGAVPLCGTKESYSKDNGITWEPWRDVGILYYSSMMPKPTKLSDGTIIVPVRDRGPYRPKSNWDTGPAAWSYAFKRPGSNEWVRRELNDEPMMYGEFVQLSDNRVLLVGSSEVLGTGTQCSVWCMDFTSDGPSKRLYYDNYTGNDLSARGASEDLNKANWTRRLFSNWKFLSTDKDVEVWKNFCANPGFESAYSIVGGNQHYKELGTQAMERPGGCKASIVDTDWSVSGKALMVESVGVDDGADTYNTRVWPQWVYSEIETGFDGTPLWGRTFTFKVSVFLKARLAGTTDSNPPLKMTMSLRNKAGVETQNVAVSNSGNVNLIGQKQDLIFTYTFPAKGNSAGHTRFHVNLHLGSWAAGGSAEFSEFLIMETSSLPPFKGRSYFDGSYSPDVDLTPTWTGEPGKSISILTGRQIEGVAVSSGGVLIQSTQTKEKPTLITSSNPVEYSARFINTSGSSACRAVLLLDGLAKGARIRSWQEKALTGIDSTTFASLGVGENNYFGRGRNASYWATLTTSNTVPQDHIILHGGYSALGESIWWRTLEVSPTTTISSLPNRRVVIFSEGLDNFKVEKSLSSMASQKTTAYVSNGKNIEKVGDGTDRKMFFRRVVLVDGDETSPTRPDFKERQTQIGREAVLEQPAKFTIEGETTAASEYVYDVDYSLGDLVLVEDFYGRRRVMRVVEYVFISDEQGERSYPTVQMDPISSTGEWTSSEYNIPWSDAEPLGAWINQP